MGLARIACLIRCHYTGAWYRHTYNLTYMRRYTLCEWCSRQRSEYLGDSVGISIYTVDGSPHATASVEYSREPNLLSATPRRRSRRPSCRSDKLPRHRVQHSHRSKQQIAHAFLTYIPTAVPCEGRKGNKEEKKKKYIYYIPDES